MFNYWKIYSDKHLYRKWRARKFIEIIPFAILRYCHSQTHTHMLAFSFNAPHSTPCLLLTLGKVIYVYRRNTNSQNMFYTWWKGMRVCKIGIMKPEDKMLQIWHLKKNRANCENNEFVTHCYFGILVETMTPSLLLTNTIQSQQH